MQVGPSIQHVLTECATGYIVEQINYMLGTRFHILWAELLGCVAVIIYQFFLIFFYSISRKGGALAQR